MKPIEYNGYQIRQSEGHGSGFKTGSIQVMDVWHNGSRLCKAFKFTLYDSSSIEKAIQKAKDWIDKNLKK